MKTITAVFRWADGKTATAEGRFKFDALPGFVEWAGATDRLPGFDDLSNERGHQFAYSLRYLGEAAGARVTVTEHGEWLRLEM